MGLFTPDWNSKSYMKASRAVDKITDEKKLQKIAFMAIDQGIRKLAAKKITDQNVLIAIAKKTDETESVREAAVKRITDQNALIEIAKTDEDVREAAIERITDQNALIEIMMLPNSYRGSKNIIEKLLPYPHFIKKILLSCNQENHSAIFGVLNYQLPDNIVQIVNKEEYKLLRSKFAYKDTRCNWVSTDCGNGYWGSGDRSGLTFPPFNG